MNGTEKKHMLFLNAMVHKSQHIIDEISSGRYGQTPEGKKFLKQLRHGRTLLKNALDERIDGLDAETKRWLEKNSLLLDLHWGYKKEAVDILKKYLEEERSIREQVAREAGVEPLYLLAEYAMAFKCTGCDGSPLKSPDGCPLHETLRLFRIPLSDDTLACGYINDVNLESLALPDLWKEEIGSLKTDLIAARSEAKASKSHLQDASRQIDKLKETISTLQQSLQTEQEQNGLLKAQIGEIAQERDKCRLGNDRMQREIERIQRDRAFYKSEAQHLGDENRKIKNVAAVVFEGLDLLREMSAGESIHQDHPADDGLPHESDTNE